MFMAWQFIEQVAAVVGAFISSGIVYLVSYIRSKVLSLTPQDRKKLGINKSTLWYMQKHIREGKKIKVYGKVMGKISE
jgi:hypothetical protein